MSRRRPEIRKGSRVWVRIPDRVEERDADGKLLRAYTRRVAIKATVTVRNGRADPPYVLVRPDDPSVSAAPLRFPVADVRILGVLDSLAEAAAEEPPAPEA